jgi:hypothetical protein
MLCAVTADERVDTCEAGDEGTKILQFVQWPGSTEWPKKIKFNSLQVKFHSTPLQDWPIIIIIILLFLLCTVLCNSY